MKKVIAILLMLTVVFSFTGASTAVVKPDYTLNISEKNISNDISPELYGISLDGDDGALSSNLVSNNSFENKENPLYSWAVSAKDYNVKTDDPINESNGTYLYLDVDGTAEVKNIGYTEIYNNNSFDYNKRKAETPDMGFKADEEYEFSAFFKNIGFEGTVTVLLTVGNEAQKVQFDIDDFENWKKITLTLKSSVTADGALSVSFDGKGTLLMDSVTLVPKQSYGFGTDNWKYVSLRQDLFEALKELSPKFIRFTAQPQSDSIENLSSWKDTIGPLHTRGHLMGIHEYFTLCDELGATPVPVLSAGISSQNDYAETAEKYENGALSEEKWQEYLDTIAIRPGTEEWTSYIDGVLDLIEYANGDASTEWGAKRAENGHSEPFNMKYLSVGYENFGEVYFRNFDAVYNEVKAKYPDIKLVISAGTSYEGDEFDASWETVNDKYRDTIVDEHLYTDGEYHFYNTDRYDSYERSGASVAVGEYSKKSRRSGTVITKNHIWSSIENAAFLTGLERNGDVVKMASYGSTLSKVNAQSRDTSLLWFDSQSLLKTPDYYMQMMFSNNVGTKYISTDFDREDEGVYSSVTVDTDKKVIYLKLVNSSRSDRKIDINLDGFAGAQNPTVQYMDETFKSACNEFDENISVAPVEKNLEIKDGTIAYNCGSLSVSVIRIPYGGNDGSALYTLPEIGLITPYLHPGITVALPCFVGLLIVITGAVILTVRIKHHKAVRKKEETEE